MNGMDAIQKYIYTLTAEIICVRHDKVVDHIFLLPEDAFPPYITRKACNDISVSSRPGETRELAYVTIKIIPSLSNGGCERAYENKSAPRRGNISGMCPSNFNILSLISASI